MIENIYNKLIDELSIGNQAVLATLLKEIEQERSQGRNKMLFTEEAMNSKKSMDNMEENIYDKVKDVLESGRLHLERNEDDGMLLLEPFYPEPQLIILGGGHIAKPLVEFGAKLGYKMTVVDDRPFFANKERFPEADQVICESFERCFDKLKLNKSAFVVIVTRGHRHDLVCLNNVLKHETAYIGMIGSKHRVSLVKESLVNEGFSPDELEGINAPIGLSIGALTPEEIAISIIAQIISVRRLGTPAPDGKQTKSKGKWLEFDIDVFKELAKASNEPKALVTVISTKGSVPRHSGAKMIVWPQGKILGSIGGGCCEAEVIIAARDIIKEGGCMIKTVDMTLDDAEKEGMVCGGTMEVLIEAVK